MLAGKLYDPSDEELLKLRLNARLLTEELNTTSVEFHQKRVEIIRHLFGTTGDNIHIESYFNCDYGSNIHVGDNFGYPEYLVDFWLSQKGPYSLPHRISRLMGAWFTQGLRPVNYPPVGAMVQIARRRREVASRSRAARRERGLGSTCPAPSSGRPPCRTVRPATGRR
ncbi:maltose acetyltransferase domain-containing protein [Halomonas alimentaria]|uniref:maltose acetyltransferase domain-containing protein n=1 Tax=Halomonas alimentaria TaxID=147248 RepID=UPI001F0FDD54|nr:maltose acetyltransferase domain-containing protein [Halomonas alimentaria]